MYRSAPSLLYKVSGRTLLYLPWRNEGEQDLPEEGDEVNDEVVPLEGDVVTLLVLVTLQQHGAWGTTRGCNHLGDKLDSSAQTSANIFEFTKNLCSMKLSEL